MDKVIINFLDNLFPNSADLLRAISADITADSLFFCDAKKLLLLYSRLRLRNKKDGCLRKTIRNALNAKEMPTKDWVELYSYFKTIRGADNLELLIIDKLCASPRTINELVAAQKATQGKFGSTAKIIARANNMLGKDHNAW